MNLLLLLPEYRLADDLWRIDGARYRHITNTLGLGPGDQLRAGVLDGAVGHARIVTRTDDHLTVRFHAEGEPPAPLPLTVILALPRPKMLKRIILDATSLGVKTLVLLNSWKVDKSYWQTPELKGELLREKMVLGLEQAMDTRMPALVLAPRFKPFVEDQLEALTAGTRKLLAHPGDYPPMPAQLDAPLTVAIGPEGGWTPYEVEMLCARGFACHSLGARILRVETALPTLVGRLLG